ncbi:MAG: glycosyltransferase, partial [Acidimicrobiales bacterium]|nr:glycosyltransferase [Acidimicrobiales bacterium]
ELRDVEQLADSVTAAFTERWNSVLAMLAPERPSVEDAFRVHGHRVLYNSVSSLHSAVRSLDLNSDHRFVGPLVREETLPENMDSWRDQKDNRPRIYVALGTFLSHRVDVLICIAEALREIGARAAMAVGSMSERDLGPVPDDWIVSRELPQVAMLRYADLAIHHGGNNSVQECLGAGARQLVLPFSTDQFANAADLERAGVASVLPPNEMSTTELVEAILSRLDTVKPKPESRMTKDSVIEALFE